MKYFDSPMMPMYIMAVIRLTLFVSLFVSIYLMKTKSLRTIRRQDHDIVVRLSTPCRLNYKDLPRNPEVLLDHLYKGRDMTLVYDEIGDDGKYYAFDTPDDIDPHRTWLSFIHSQNFDGVYITKKGEKKHKKLAREKQTA